MPDLNLKTYLVGEELNHIYTKKTSFEALLCAWWREKTEIKESIGLRPKALSQKPGL